jgi:aspartyl-tRNA(Asn)/glutamyl-tRNA(Gln) amidotransferase subunit C
MTLQRDDVAKVASLARLRLPEEELLALGDQLAKIVHYIKQLGELNTDDVEPLAHPLEITNVFADDDLRESLPRESALANAPKRDDETYRVPAVLGE